MLSSSSSDASSDEADDVDGGGTGRFRTIFIGGVDFASGTATVDCVDFCGDGVVFLEGGFDASNDRRFVSTCKNIVLLQDWPNM